MSFRSHRLAWKAIAALATCLPCCVLTAAEEELVPARAVDFELDVQPIFAAHCVSCHGKQRRRAAFGSTAATRPLAAATMAQPSCWARRLKAR